MSFRARLAVTAFIIITIISSGLYSLVALAQPQPDRQTPESTPPASFPQPAGWPAILRSAGAAETLGPGVRYEHWKLLTQSGPLEVSIATIDLCDPSVALLATSHGGVIQGNGERLSAMADRVHAEVGINADYFDINESGAPLNVLVENGRLIHQPDAAAAFVAQSGNQAGRPTSIIMQPLPWHANITTASGSVRSVSSLNEWSQSSTLALITPELGRADATGTLEIIFSPLGSASHGQTATFRVSQTDSNPSSLNGLAVGQVALVARGAQAQSAAADFALGDTVSIAIDIEPSLASVRLAIGGGPLLLKDGQYFADPFAPAPEETNVRNPVTAAGLSADGATMWLVVVDGRSPSKSIGLTRPMLAALMARLGAVIAMAFDSGGSSEMVVRHLGDAGTSVANAPSDGRERGIADGLFVVNTAPVGAPQQLLVRAPAQRVLAGSHLQLFASAVDANQQPVPLDSNDLQYSVRPSGLAGVSTTGLLATRRSGDAVIDVRARGLSTAVGVGIVSHVANLRIQGFDRVVPLGTRIALSITAQDSDGIAISLDPDVVRWHATGAGGSVSQGGVFQANHQPGLAHISADAGAVQASLVIPTGDHLVSVQKDLLPGVQAPRWRFHAQPAQMTGGVDEMQAPDGSHAMRLSYDFSTSEATRAAYAESALTMCGEPLAVAIDVFGDGNGEWLRGGYRNVDGNPESLTLARHVDWHGWRTLRVPIPPQIAWPIVWTRFYVVERGKDAQEQGAIWLRNFAAAYAGPAMLGCDRPD